MHDHVNDLEKTLAMKNDDITTLEDNNSSLKRNLDGNIYHLIFVILSSLSSLSLSLDAINSYESEQKKRKLDKEEFDNMSTSLKTEYDNKIESISNDHAQSLAMEMERSRSLAANVEEEKVSLLSLLQSPSSF